MCNLHRRLCGQMRLLLSWGTFTFSLVVEGMLLASKDKEGINCHRIPITTPLSSPLFSLTGTAFDRMDVVDLQIKELQTEARH